MKNKGLPTKLSFVGKIIVHSKKSSHLIQSYVASICASYAQDFLAT
jgi:hypothetical protein